MKYVFIVKEKYDDLYSIYINARFLNKKDFKYDYDYLDIEFEDAVYIVSKYMLTHTIVPYKEEDLFR